MDLIYKLTITVLLALTLVTAGMLVQNHLAVTKMQGTVTDPKVDLQKFYADKIAKDAILYGTVEQLLQKKQFDQVDARLLEIEASHPDNVQSLIYRAELQYAYGKSASAIHNYRLAVNKTPDYVDKKTPLYIGDKIMVVIDEARTKLKRERKLKPADMSIRVALEDIYYLQRRIAGGCE